MIFAPIVVKNFQPRLLYTALILNIITAHTVKIVGSPNRGSTMFFLLYFFRCSNLVVCYTLWYDCGNIDCIYGRISAKKKKLRYVCGASFVANLMF